MITFSSKNLYIFLDPFFVQFYEAKISDKDFSKKRPKSIMLNVQWTLNVNIIVSKNTV